MERELRIPEFLSELSRRGVALRLEKGSLRYSCQRGSLLPEDLEILRAHRETIIQSLSLEPPTEVHPPTIVPRSSLERIPLSWMQKGMWDAFERLKLTQSKRTMATALRLKGPLNIDLVQRSIAHVVQRHEALRTRIVVIDGVPFQEVRETVQIELPIIDLTGIPSEELEQAAKSAVDAFIDIPISLTEDELFACQLIRLREADHILITALDHVIVDNLSMHILWTEIDAIYTDLYLGRPASLPPVTIQFPDYAVWEQKHQWTPRKAAFWESRIKTAGRVRLPCGQPAPRGKKLAVAEIPIKFGAPLTAALRETSLRCGSTLVMCTLSAYLAATLIWSGESVITSGFVITGRDIPGLDGTIGWFGTVLLLCVQLRPVDSFRDLVQRVTRDYYLALEHADHGRVGLDRPRCLWNTSFNFRVGLETALPPAQARLRTEPLRDGVVATPFEFKDPMIDIDWSDDPELADGEPGIFLTDSPTGITGTFVYRPDLHAANLMERFCSDFIRLCHALSEDLDRRVFSTPCGLSSTT